MTLNMEREDGLRYPARAIVDTNVILNVALGKMDNLPATCLDRSKQLLDDAISGQFELLLPSIALIELSSDHIIHADGNPTKRQYKEMKHKVMQWCEDSTLDFADLTLPAAEWYHDNTSIQCIRPIDSAILATAKYANATVVYSWDDKFIEFVKKANATASIGISVRHPPECPITLFDE